MAYHLLERDRDRALELSSVIGEAMRRVGRCARCRTLTELEVCALCAAGNRDATTLCVVESPVDMEAIEAGTGFRGGYFVLQAESYDAAVDIARSCPHLTYGGSIELRRIDPV